MKLKFTEDVYREIYNTTTQQTKGNELEENLKLLGEKNALDRIKNIKAEKLSYTHEAGKIINVIESLENKKRMSFSFEKQYKKTHSFSPENGYEYIGKLIITNNDIKKNTIVIEKDNFKTGKYIAIESLEEKREENKRKYEIKFKIKVPKNIEEGIYKEYIYVSIKDYNTQKFDIVLECNGDFEEKYKKYKFNTIEQLFNIYEKDKENYKLSKGAFLQSVMYFNNKEFPHYLRRKGYRNEAEVYYKLNKRKFNLNDIKLFFSILGFEEMEEKVITTRLDNKEIIKHKYTIELYEQITIADFSKEDKIVIYNNEKIEVIYGEDILNNEKKNKCKSVQQTYKIIKRQKLLIKIPFINRLKKVSNMKEQISKLEKSIIVINKEYSKERNNRKSNKLSKVKIIQKNKKIYEYTIYTLE